MEMYPLTKLTDYNPLWKVQAWCRRNLGTYYLYEQRDGNVDISTFERSMSTVDVHDKLLELWRDGELIYRDPRRPKKTEVLEKLVG